MYKVGGLVNDIQTLLEKNRKPEIKRKWTEHDGVCEYLNIPAAFDIEVSSFYTIVTDEKGKKVTKKQSCMYIWMFGLNGDVVIGRDWASFKETMDAVREFYDLSETRYLPVYVHNLGYEFGSTFNTLFNWTNIFARDTHAPMKCVCEEGFEFRCSYMLSGQSLEGTGKDLVKYKVEKMVGDLDYDKLRLPANRAYGFEGTPLDEKELGYCINDVLVVMSFIKEEMELVGNDITRIPLTKTGKVRKYCQDKCLRDKKTGKAYKQMIRSLTISDVTEYEMLKRAFQGGFTHACVKRANRKIKKVKSWDFTSSYPTVMISEKYPMSKPTRTVIRDYQHYKDLCQNYLLIFNVKFKNIVMKNDWENPISESKCFNAKKVVSNNGRLMAAEEITMTITNVDFDIYEEYYDWDEVEFGNALVYIPGYLPKSLVECVLEFYEGKTTLKNVPGMEVEYLLKKGLLNSVYGCSVQDVINDDVIFDCGIWYKETGDIESQLEKYNTNKKRFLYYPWGVFVTAYARRNLFYGITEFGKTGDYIYSDTDSVKVTNYEDHMDFIIRYNDWITERLERACKFHGIDPNRLHPMTAEYTDEKGEVHAPEAKPIGVWDDDGFYEEFKTLGAKRYMVYDGKKIKTTIAGASKKKVSEFMTEMKKAGQQDPFDFFTSEMTIDEEHSGRLIVSYIPFEMDGVATDYLGNTCSYHEECGVHMEKSEYNLTITPAYLSLCHEMGQVYEEAQY